MCKKLSWSRFSWGECDNHRMGEPNSAEETEDLSFFKPVQKETKVSETVIAISACRGRHTGLQQKEWPILDTG